MDVMDNLGVASGGSSQSFDCDERGLTVSLQDGLKKRRFSCVNNNNDLPAVPEAHTGSVVGEEDSSALSSLLAAVDVITTSPMKPPAPSTLRVVRPRLEDTTLSSPASADTPLSESPEDGPSSDSDSVLSPTKQRQLDDQPLRYPTNEGRTGHQTNDARQYHHQQHHHPQQQQQHRSGRAGAEEGAIVTSRRETLTEVARRVPMRLMRSVFHVPLVKAAEELDMSISTLKRLCKLRNLPRWPYRELSAVKSAFAAGTTTEKPGFRHPHYESMSFCEEQAASDDAGGSYGSGNTTGDEEEDDDDHDEGRAGLESDNDADIETEEGSGGGGGGGSDDVAGGGDIFSMIGVRPAERSRSPSRFGRLARDGDVGTLAGDDRGRGGGGGGGGGGRDASPVGDSSSLTRTRSCSSGTYSPVDSDCKAATASALNEEFGSSGGSTRRGRSGGQQVTTAAPLSKAVVVEKSVPASTSVSTAKVPVNRARTRPTRPTRPQRETLDDIATRVPLDLIKRCFHMRLREAAKHCCVSVTSMKRLCRLNKISRWPQRRLSPILRTIVSLERRIKEGPPPNERRHLQSQLDEQYRFKEQTLNSIIGGSGGGDDDSGDEDDGGYGGVDEEEADDGVVNDGDEGASHVAVKESSGAAKGGDDRGGYSLEAGMEVERNVHVQSVRAMGSASVAAAVHTTNAFSVAENLDVYEGANQLLAMCTMRGVGSGPYLPRSRNGMAG